MKLISTRSLLLTAAAGLFAATGATVLAGDAIAPAAPEAPAMQTKEVRVQKVIVRESGDTTATPGQSIFLTSRAVTGENPTTELTLIGAGGEPEVFNAGDLEIGQTRTFTSASGKAIEVTRTEAGMSLVVDGKTIALPEMSGDAKVMAFAHEGQPGTAHEVRVVKVLSGNGDVLTENIEGGDVMTWEHAAPAAFAFAGPAMDFEKLESLKGLDPEVREKVIAALKEIMANPHVIAVDVNSAAVAMPEPGAHGASVPAPRAQ